LTRVKKFSLAAVCPVYLGGDKRNGRPVAPGSRYGAPAADPGQGNRPHTAPLKKKERQAIAVAAERYGGRAEKLAEYNLQPFRGRNRTAKAKGAVAEPRPADA
jgi:hypothetical protein